MKILPYKVHCIHVLSSFNRCNEFPAIWWVQIVYKKVFRATSFFILMFFGLIIILIFGCRIDGCWKRNWDSEFFSRARWSGKTRLRQTEPQTLPAVFLNTFSKFWVLVSEISIHKYCLQKGSDPNHFCSWDFRVKSRWVPYIGGIGRDGRRSWEWRGIS